MLSKPYPSDLGQMDAPGLQAELVIADIERVVLTLLLEDRIFADLLEEPTEGCLEIRERLLIGVLGAIVDPRETNLFDLIESLLEL